MKEIKVYNAIHQLKERGFKKDSVAKQLDINWRTVDRYWDMTIEEYESQARQLKRGSQLDDYKDQILLWLRQYPAMTAAQVGDWLKEHYKAAFKERTVSRYVKRLREEYGLKKTVTPRDYEAVPELPMGQQIQVDFGQKLMPNVDGGLTKVYAAVFLLARSRYKYAEMQSRPSVISVVCRRRWSLTRTASSVSVRMPETLFTPMNLKSSGRKPVFQSTCAVEQIRKARARLKTV